MTWFFIALLSSFLSAFAAITQKKVLFNLNPVQFSFYLSIANLVLSIPFFFFIDYNAINFSNLSVLFIKSLIGVAAFLCVMTALKNLQISNALPLLALTPGFVAVFAFLFLGETLKFYEVLGLISLIAGTYILESKNIKEILFPLNIFFKSRYHQYILAALLLFTASSVMDKLLVTKMNLTPISLTGHLFRRFAKRRKGAQWCRGRLRRRRLHEAALHNGPLRRRVAGIFHSLVFTRL